MDKCTKYRPERSPLSTAAPSRTLFSLTNKLRDVRRQLPRSVPWGRDSSLRFRHGAQLPFCTAPQARRRPTAATPCRAVPPRTCPPAQPARRRSPTWRSARVRCTCGAETGHRLAPWRSQARGALAGRANCPVTGQREAQPRRQWAARRACGAGACWGARVCCWQARAGGGRTERAKARSGRGAEADVGATVRARVGGLWRTWKGRWTGGDRAQRGRGRSFEDYCNGARRIQCH